MGNVSLCHLSLHFLPGSSQTVGAKVVSKTSEPFEGLTIF